MLKKTVTIIKIIVHLCKMLKHIILFTLATIVVDGNVRLRHIIFLKPSCLLVSKKSLYFIYCKRICSTASCVGKFFCGNVNITNTCTMECITNTLVCDGTDDCTGGADEVGCLTGK